MDAKIGEVRPEKVDYWGEVEKVSNSAGGETTSGRGGCNKLATDRFEAQDRRHTY